MNYKCPECGNTEEPHAISYFPPIIYECQNCGMKGSEKDFIEKKTRGFSSLPPPPPR